MWIKKNVLVKMLIIRLSLWLWTCVEKTVHTAETYLLSGKQNVKDGVIRKVGDADISQDLKGPVTVNSTSHFQFFWQKSRFLLKDFRVNIYIYIYTFISKVGDRSRGWTEGLLFNSYYTEYDEEIWHTNTFAGLCWRQLRLSGCQRMMVVRITE